MNSPHDPTEDGGDPRRYHDRRNRHRGPAAPGSTGRPPGRKATQLAEQVRELVSALLAASADDRLRSLEIGGVTPAPDSSRMLVVVRAGGEVTEAEAALAAAASWLRLGVAEGITRKRVPVLAFGVVAAGGQGAA